MSATPQIQLIPEGQFSNKDLDTFLFELERRWKAKEVMHRKEAADYLGITTRTLDRLTTEGALPYHQIEGLSAKLYLRSELLEKLKRSKFPLPSK